MSFIGLLTALLLASSTSLLANPISAHRADLPLSATSFYNDSLFGDARARYYLTTLVLRLGVPGYGERFFEEDMLVYPKDTDTLRRLLASTNKQPEAAIRAFWQDDALAIQVNAPGPNDTPVEYNVLLLEALRLIQQINNNTLPVISGRALKAALTNKTGQSVIIFKRNTKPKTSNTVNR